MVHIGAFTEREEPYVNEIDEQQTDNQSIGRSTPELGLPNEVVEDEDEADHRRNAQAGQQIEHALRSFIGRHHVRSSAIGSVLRPWRTRSKSECAVSRAIGRWTIDRHTFSATDE